MDEKYNISLILSDIDELNNNLQSLNISKEATVRVPDPSDFEWIAERDRLRRMYTNQFTAQGIPQSRIEPMVDNELRMNKPLGREQRFILEKTSTISNNEKLTTKKKLDEIYQEVQDGRTENRASALNVVSQLSDLTKDIKDLENLSAQEFQIIGNILGRINLPSTYKELGFIAKYVDHEFYKANEGMINLLFLSKVKAEEGRGNL